jgi:leucyl aminopeptidase (aminopeptidase T)
MNLDAELLEGARNALRVCMGVTPTDRVLILTDNDTALVGEALLIESLAIHAVTEAIRLEQYGNRPFAELPGAIRARLNSFLPSVTFLAVSAKPGEFPMRDQFADEAQVKLRARHAHMPNVSPAIMREGMRVDYEMVSRITSAVHDKVQNARHILVRSARGSEIHGRFSGTFKWIPFGGLYHKPGDWGNLPEGEVFTCPDSVDGVLAADVVGDYFAPKYGVLQSPVTISFEKGYAHDIECADKKLEEELSAYLDSQENGRRVGEFAIGTNIGVRALRGNILQDEKIPGLHIGIGDPLGVATGADWHCRTHVDLVPSSCTIFVDGDAIMEDGRFTLDM